MRQPKQRMQFQRVEDGFLHFPVAESWTPLFCWPVGAAIGILVIMYCFHVLELSNGCLNFIGLVVMVLYMITVPSARVIFTLCLVFAALQHSGGTGIPPKMSESRGLHDDICNTVFLARLPDRDSHERRLIRLMVHIFSSSSQCEHFICCGNKPLASHLVLHPAMLLRHLLRP